MDPNAALTRLIVCLQTNERDDAIEILHGLTRWIDRGGFLPTIKGTARVVDNVVELKTELHK